MLSINAILQSSNKSFPMKKDIPFNDTSESIDDFPHVSLLIPFSPAMTKQPGLGKLLASAVDKAERDLMINYSPDRTNPVIKKLRHLIQNVKISRNEQTLALFVSPSSEKIYYFTPSHAGEHFLPVLVQSSNKWDKNTTK